MRYAGYNRVAVVTGAASGIGKEMARAFRRESAKVAIADLNQAGVDSAACVYRKPRGIAFEIGLSDLGRFAF
ncbi:MAG: SDR family NAD(P)-dependent oxidoreductase [Methylocystis sp.]